MGEIADIQSSRLLGRGPSHRSLVDDVKNADPRIPRKDARCHRRGPCRLLVRKRLLSDDEKRPALDCSIGHGVEVQKLVLDDALNWLNLVCQEVVDAEIEAVEDLCIRKPMIGKWDGDNLSHFVLLPL